MYVIYIYGNIYHQYTPNVSTYIPHMDPIGVYIYIHICTHVCPPIVYIIYNLSNSYIPRNIILNKEPHKYQTYHNKLHYHIGGENQKSW